jgi:glycosyltransferase involved in cell wall biosynthesis
MKIAYIVNANIPDDWAHSVQIMSMCKALSENGVEVVLIVPNRKILQNVDPFQYYGISKIFSIKKLYCFDTHPGSPTRMTYWIRFISFYFSARFYVWFHYFDFLYSRDLYSAIFFPSIILEQHSFPRKINFLHKIIFSSKRKAIVLTSFIKSRLVTAGLLEKNILVSPSGVNLKDFNSGQESVKIEGITEGDFVFGYIGTLKTMGMEKGVSDGISALTFLDSSYKFLVVGGEKNDLEYYKQMAKELGVLNRTIFVGKVAYLDVPKYLSVCDIFIAPFPKNEHYSFFMSPLKFFEYMASKKPIISTTLPSIVEVLEDNENSILIPPNDPKSLSVAIVKLKNNPELGKRLADKAFILVSEKYTWKKRAENILNFIQL